MEIHKLKLKLNKSRSGICTRVVTSRQGTRRIVELAYCSCFWNTHKQNIQISDDNKFQSAKLGGLLKLDALNP